MKKKLLMILLLVVAACACAFGFAGCDLFNSNESGENGSEISDSNDSAGNDVGNAEEHEHTLVKYEAKESTCQEFGYIEHWYCKTCNKYFSDAEAKHAITQVETILPKAQHKEVVDSAVAPTCTSYGKTEGRHCSVCNTVTLAQTVIPKIAHVEVVDAAVAATCTTDGKTEGKHCSVCKTVIVAQKTIPAAHTEVIDKGYPATCTSDGLTNGMHCSECGLIIVEQLVLTGGHTEVIDEGYAATCTTDGKTAGKHCSVCNEVLIEQIIIPAAHTPVTEAGYPATCTSTGLTDYIYCSECKLVLSAPEEIPMTGHSGSGNLCDTCGGLRVAASEGLTFNGISSVPYSARSVDIIGYEVTGIGTCTDANLVIPETHNGLPVLGIADSAFLNLPAGYSFIRTVTIPSSVKYIGSTAFGYLPNLREVYIAGSVTEIVESAFRNCTSLISFKCPDGLNEITMKMFSGDTQLEYVIINKSITTVNFSAFTDCTSLTDIYFEGTEARWEEVKESWADGINPAVHFYSETEPTDEGNFWHYGADGNPVKWN